MSMYYQEKNIGHFKRDGDSVKVWNSKDPFEFDKIIKKFSRQNFSTLRTLKQRGLLITRGQKRRAMVNRAKRKTIKLNRLKVKQGKNR